MLKVGGAITYLRYSLAANVALLKKMMMPIVRSVYREPLQPQSPQKQKLPTLDDERFNHAVAAVEGSKFSKSVLIH